MAKWKQYLKPAEQQELDEALAARDAAMAVARRITAKLKHRCESRMREEAKREAGDG